MERSRGRDYLVALAYGSLAIVAVAASLFSHVEFDMDFGTHDPPWAKALMAAAGVHVVMLAGLFLGLPVRQPSHGMCLCGLLMLCTGCLASISVAMLLFNTWLALPSSVFLLSLTFLFSVQGLRMLRVARTAKRSEDLPRPSLKQWLVIALALAVVLPALKVTLRLEDSARPRRPWQQGDPVERTEPLR